MTTQTSNNPFVRRPLLAYFVLAYAFLWLYYLGIVPLLLGLLRLDMRSSDWLSALLTVIAGWTPALAAAIVTGACDGTGGVRRLFGMFFHFRLPARWYLAALLPALLAIAAGGLYHVLGGAAAAGAALSPATWAFVLCSGLLGAATGEEPGWRGFALPRLLQKYNPLTASLLLSAVWSGFHLPVLFARGLMGLDLLIYLLVYLVYNFSLTALMTWIFLRTPASLVPMVLAHFTANVTPVVMVAGLGLGQEIPVFYVTTGLSFITILLIWAKGGFVRQTKPQEMQRLETGRKLTHPSGGIR